jgi:uncharacterized repeat protein (TIGR03803 family)
MTCTLGMKSVRSNWSSLAAYAVLCALLLATSAPAHAATETVLYNFTGGSDSDMPTGPLTLYNGNLYGTTQGSSFQGGVGPGAVYELSPNGVGGWNESTLYTFCSLPGCADGEYPNDGTLLFDSLGNIYGTTEFGGAYGYGTVFELSPVGGSWTETVLYSFANNGDGAYPVNPGFFDSAGNLYGTLFAGTASGVFELSPSGGGWTEQLIYSDQGTWASVTPDGNGDIFGTSATTIFKLSPNGGGWTPTTLFTFTNATKNGSGPNGTLVFNKAGDLYGTTVTGGKSNAGTVFKLTPVLSGKKKGTWTEKLLCSFKGGPKDGANPYGAVVFDGAGNIYGATVGGGKGGYGVVYELVFTPTTGKYKEKVVWSFTGTAGANPGAQGWVPLIPDGQGNFYSVTVVGGTDNFGLAFELTP